MATLKNDLSLRNLTYEDAIKMALDKPLQAELRTYGACRLMMMMIALTNCAKPFYWWQQQEIFSIINAHKNIYGFCLTGTVIYYLFGATPVSELRPQVKRQDSCSRFLYKSDPYPNAQTTR